MYIYIYLSICPIDLGFRLAKHAKDVEKTSGQSQELKFSSVSSMVLF